MLAEKAYVLEKGTLVPSISGNINLENLGYKSNNSTILKNIKMDICLFCQHYR